MLSVLKKLFDENLREVQRLRTSVERINQLEDEFRRIPDEAMAAKMREYAERIQSGVSTDSVLNEVFALVREVSRRKLDMRHFDVQLVGGIVLHQGRIAEMATGEGKTLVATTALVLNALEGRGAHLVTVNDYLARRDAMWMGPIYLTLGLRVGVLQHDSSYLIDWDPAALYGTRMVPCTRREAYQADITYGTNSEFGFDYLRDNMVYRISDKVQRPLYYAIVDEVDSILIDEARTPLIISGMGEEDTEKYVRIARVIERLTESDVEIKEKEHSVTLTPEGLDKVERALGITNLYDFENSETNHLVYNALKARFLMKADRDYVVKRDPEKGNEIIIVDEFTGRLMYGRRYSDGLHQAIEAKEKVPVRAESQTLATITIQNYFRMYKKLAGMTGTAKTEEREFIQIYDMDVVVIPTNKPLIRQRLSDVVYKTERAKFRGVVQEIVTRNRMGQPVLVGTTSIEKSERLSEMLKREGVTHAVLNAKHHEREAEIVAQAGRFGAVTIATNMAGRGTDILLGGNPAFLARQALKNQGIDPDANPQAYLAELSHAKEITRQERERVVQVGGLHVIGTERHEARRIDNQLRGRAGRQGDPGSSQFFLSLEDDIMRKFGQDRVKWLMDRLNFPEDEPLQSRMLDYSIETVQKRVEAHNFEIRKNLLRYDDVLNKHREVIYQERDRILTEASFHQKVFGFVENVVNQLMAEHCPEALPCTEWRYGELFAEIKRLMPIAIEESEIRLSSREALTDLLQQRARTSMEARFAELGEQIAEPLSRIAALRAIDERWREHLEQMTALREGVSLRAYGQVDPLVIYAKEAFSLFEHLKNNIQKDIVRQIFLARVERAQPERVPTRLRYTAPDETGGVSQEVIGRASALSGDGTRGARKRRVGRNDPCPCGSGKKYKKCCLLKDIQAS
ncbi:MAG: preprotein translocase subunit SecA [bacterium JZ-2024 1]